MSQHIRSTQPSVNHYDHYPARQYRHQKTNNHSSHADRSGHTIQDSYRKIHEDSGTKAFASLTNSLAKAFTSAVKVDQQTGQEEMTRGGLQRIAKDLQKLFKGMGFPPQMAKQYARSISSGMELEGVEQLNVSLETTRSWTVSSYNQSGTVTSSTEGPATSQSAGLQLSAVQTQSFDVSINLTTGDFSLNRSYEQSLTLSTVATASQEETEGMTIATAEVPQVAPEEIEAKQIGTLSQEEQEQMGITASMPEPPENSTTDEFPAATDQDQVAAILFKISHSISQSALITQQQLPEESEWENSEVEQSVATEDSFYKLQHLATTQLQISYGETSLFESMTDITNLRIETIDQQEYLRFSVQAVAPVGLTAVAEDQTSSTVYPRPDGGIGEMTIEVQAA